MRLPGRVVPLHYKLYFQPDFGTLGFEGSAEVLVQVRQATDVIVLHSSGLELQSATFVLQRANISVPVIDTRLDPQHERLTVHLAAQLASRATGTLNFVFSGTLSSSLRGFYATLYKSANGTELGGAATQFEPCNARRAFPCFDEPAFKATFQLTLSIPRGRNALSNTPVLEEQLDEDNGDLKLVKFAKTPAMSTYVLAWVIGEFDFLEKTSTDRTVVRVHVQVGNTDKSTFTLDTACETLKYYRRYFNAPYPLPKMDLVGLADCPNTESWGLVMCREDCLLVDPTDSSSRTKQTVALMIAHALAHQWFGNLVTMEWWNDLWLKEGFARFMEYRCVNYLYPEFDVWTQFVARSQTPALEADALRHSHPVALAAADGQDVEDLYDEISLDKGAALIRMLHSYLEDGDFKKCLVFFLENFKYSTVRTEDLWSTMEEISVKPVGAFMQSWAETRGFPLLHVSMREDEQGTYVFLRQEPFAAADAEIHQDNTWMVPVNICVSPFLNGPWIETMMVNDTDKYYMENIKEVAWFKVNPGLLGYYRVRYDHEIAQKFLPAIRSGEMLPVDRMGIHNDVYALARSGRLSSSRLIELLAMYQGERNFTVWVSIARCLYDLNTLLEGSKIEQVYKNFVRKLVTPTFKAIGWKCDQSEHHTTKLLRQLLLELLAVFENDEVLEKAREYFKAHVHGERSMAADIRRGVYQAVAVAGHRGALESLTNLYSWASLREEKLRVAHALGFFNNETTISRVLDFALSSAVQDSFTILQSACHYRAGREQVWRLLKSKLPELWDNVALRRLVLHMSAGMASQEQAAEVRQYFQECGIPGVSRVATRAVEQIGANAAWLQRDLLAMGPSLQAAIRHMGQ